MEGRRDGPRWNNARPTASSDKPVSSYASLACGPPPSYARQGSSGSWDYGDEPHRPSSPVGRSLGAPYFPSRGTGGGGRSGRYENDRLGGRGRPIRGGRDRVDRIDRFSSSGLHRTSPDRFQNSLDRGTGYEAGEILPSQRLGSSPVPTQRRVDDRSFDMRSSRGNDMEGRGSGRFIPRGGGRDGGRGGRGGPRTFGAGRFSDRGGRGGRSDFRGRRVGDGRDIYTNKDWSSSGGRSTPDEMGRTIGGLDKPRNDDGSRYFANEPKNDQMHSRSDDRLTQQSRPYDGNTRDPLINRGPARYSSLVSNTDPPPMRVKVDTRPPEDRIFKRRRDDEDYSVDFEEKRSRNIDYVPRNRQISNNEGRFFQGGPSHRSQDDGSGVFDSRNASRHVDIRERRGLDTRGQLDRPPPRGDSGIPPPLSHDERRQRPVMESNHADSRPRAGVMNDAPYEIDPSHRVNRRPGGPSQISTLDRNDSRGMPSTIRGEVNRRFIPAREDSRVSGPTSGLRDDSHLGPASLRHSSRPDLSELRDRDMRISPDVRPRDPRDTSVPRPPQRFDVRESNLAQDRGDRYNDAPPPVPERPSIRGDTDSRQGMSASIDHNRDLRGADFRTRQTESEHGDNRPRVLTPGRLEAPRNVPLGMPQHGESWAPVTQQQPQSHSYESAPLPSHRGSWNSSQGINRSPIPSPTTIRNTLPPPNLDQNNLMTDSGLASTPLSLAGRGSSIADHREYSSGRGRGRGFRGMGRGRSDFGRFAGVNRLSSEYKNAAGLLGKDTSIQSREVWKRYPGTVPGSENPPAAEIASRSDDTKEPPKQDSENISGGKVSGSISEAPQNSSDGATSTNSGSPTADPKTIPEKEDEKPRPLSPPPKGEPSGVMKALVRLLDLEASMEYAYAKHMQLVRKQKELRSQAATLSTLPVGIDAFKEDLEALEATESIYRIE